MLLLFYLAVKKQDKTTSRIAGVLWHRAAILMGHLGFGSPTLNRTCPAQSGLLIFIPRFNLFSIVKPKKPLEASGDFGNNGHFATVYTFLGSTADSVRWYYMPYVIILLASELALDYAKSWLSFNTSSPLKWAKCNSYDWLYTSMPLKKNSTNFLRYEQKTLFIKFWNVKGNLWGQTT